MRKFTMGIVVTPLLVAGIVVVWLSLGEQAKGIVIGLILGGIGMLIGIILALAVVAIFLLWNLRWSVQNAPPVLRHGAPTYQALPPPAHTETYYPPPRPEWARGNRQWQILGRDDMPPSARQRE